MSGAAFLTAAKEGDSAGVRSLLAANPELLHFSGTGVDAVIGNTALHWAAAKGHAETLQVLLEAGARPEVRNKGDSTALHSASLNGHVACIKALLRAGVDPEEKDEFGDSALSLAQRTGNAEVVEALSTPPPAPTASECKARGNEAFGRKAYGEAIAHYTAALSAPREEGAQAEAIAPPLKVPTPAARARHLFPRGVHRLAIPC